MKFNGLNALIFVLVAALAPVQVFAKGNQKASSAKEETTSKSYLVPRGHFNLEKYEAPVAPEASFKLEVSISSWSPKKFSEASRLSQTRDFESGSVPRLSINRSFSEWNFETFAIAPKLGFSYLKIQRKGELSVAGASVEIEQEGKLAFLRAGLEFVPHLIIYGVLEPTYGLSFTPSWLQLPTSEFNEGVNRADIALEHFLGFNFYLPRAAQSLGLKSFGLTTGIEWNQKLSSKAPAGEGLLLGLKTEI